MKNKLLISLLKFTIFLGVGLGILYLIYRKQNTAYQEQCRLNGTPLDECSLLNKVIEDFGNANFFWLALVVLAFMVSNVSRALRWNMMLRNLGGNPRTVNSFLTIMLGYFANLGLPRMGEVVRPASLARYEKMPVEKVIGTVVVARIIDVLCLLAIIGIAFMLEFDTLWGYLKANASLGAGSGGLLSNPLLWIGFGVLLIALMIWRAFKERILEFAIVKRIVEILKGFLEGIKTVRGLEKPWLFWSHTVFIWLLYYLMIYLCFFSFAPTAHLGPMTALIVLVLGTFGMVIPAPGGMGTYHFFVIQALAIYGINQVEGFSFANIVFFTIQIFGNVFFGLLAVILLPVINRNYSPVLNHKRNKSEQEGFGELVFEPQKEQK